MEGSSDQQEAVFRAAMSLAESGRWPACSPAEIAAAAGVDALDPHLRDRMSILDAFARSIDQEVSRQSEEVVAGDAATTRERLLELLLLRFEALAPYKAGVLALMRRLPRNPDHALRGLPSLTRSMRETLELAGVGTSGPRGTARIAVIGLIFVEAMRNWASDDSPDMAATMRHLDSRLRRAEDLEVRCGRLVPAWIVPRRSA